MKQKPHLRHASQVASLRCPRFSDGTMIFNVCVFRRVLRYCLAVLALAAINQYVFAQIDGDEPEWTDSWFAPDAAPLWRVRSEYLGWWTSGNHLPPLVSTSPDNAPRAEAGVLGTNGARTLFGDQRIDMNMRSGGRVTITGWFGGLEDTALEFVGFYVGDDTATGNFSASSTGLPILARPFINSTGLVEDAELVAYPGVIAGTVAVQSYSEIYSAASLLRHNIGLGPLGRIDFLGGYRYFRLRENLSIRENLVSTDQGGVIPLGTTTDLLDQFRVGNDFHGAETGLSAELFWSRVSVELIGKVALGGVFRHAEVSGRTITTIPGNTPTVAPGGLLSQPTNIGSRSQSGFGVLPEFGINTRTAVWQGTSLIFGYNLIVLNDVLRTGDQIDRVVNISQIGGGALQGPANPAFEFHRSTLVLQGINVGLDLRW